METSELKNKIIDESKAISDYIIQMRQEIHSHPETLFEEYQTQALIERELHSIGLKTTKTADTGVIAVIEGGKAGPTIALRADTDALDVKEENDVPYKSKIPNKMHACGHDAHVATLLGAAKVITKFKDQLEGKVKLIFQPAEEGGGGGKRIVDEGHLDDVDTIVGIHVWNELPAGVIGLRPGPLLASADSFIINIQGKGGHAASPQNSIDPTVPLVDIYNALQKLITREVAPIEPIVLTTPSFKGSDAFNVVPSVAVLKGTLRTYDLTIREYILTRITEIVEHYSKAWRCQGSFTLDKVSYPPLINSAEVVSSMQEILKDLGELNIPNPDMGGEDFAFYLHKTKGAFILLGTRNEEKGIHYPHHHPRFNVDETVLWKGTAIYALAGFLESLKQ